MSEQGRALVPCVVTTGDAAAALITFALILLCLALLQAL